MVIRLSELNSMFNVTRSHRRFKRNCHFKKQTPIFNFILSVLILLFATKYFEGGLKHKINFDWPHLTYMRH